MGNNNPVSQLGLIFVQQNNTRSNSHTHRLKFGDCAIFPCQA